MFYTYCIKNTTTFELYYGYTSDLRRRCREHGRAWELIYYEAYKHEDDARERERKLKHYGNARTHLKRRLSRSLK
ncbi:MAG: hypothetical protein EXS59_02710 [Candidatus Taylorbacteria bacterium]|nr:hypothetical protein [Candidatus Taylorbacteria bacterium]